MNQRSDHGSKRYRMAATSAFASATVSTHEPATTCASTSATACAIRDKIRASLVVWSNGNLFATICDGLDAGEIFELESVSRTTAAHCDVSLRRKRYLSKRIVRGLQAFGGATAEILQGIRDAHGLVAGSILVQILLNVRWEPTDIDVFVDGLYTCDPKSEVDHLWTYSDGDLFPDTLSPGARLLRTLLRHVVAKGLSMEDSAVLQRHYQGDMEDSVFYEEDAMCVDTVRTFCHDRYHESERGDAKVVDLHARQDIVPWQVVSVACTSTKVRDMPYHAVLERDMGAVAFQRLSRLERHLLGTCDLEFLRSWFDGHCLTIWCKNALRTKSATYQVSPAPPGLVVSTDVDGKTPSPYADASTCRDLVLEQVGESKVIGNSKVVRDILTFTAGVWPNFAISALVAERIRKYRQRGFDIVLVSPPADSTWHFEIERISAAVQQRAPSADVTSLIANAFMRHGCCYCGLQLTCAGRVGCSGCRCGD